MRKDMQSTNPNFSSEWRDIKWLKFLNFYSQFVTTCGLGLVCGPHTLRSNDGGISQITGKNSVIISHQSVFGTENDMIWFMGSLWLLGWEYTRVMAGARPEARIVIRNLLQYSRWKIIEAWTKEVIWVLNSSQILYTFWKLTGFVVKLDIKETQEIRWPEQLENKSCHQMKWEKLQEDHVCWTR